jgi:hypothetical protein
VKLLVSFCLWKGELELSYDLQSCRGLSEFNREDRIRFDMASYSETLTYLTEDSQGSRSL